MVTGSAPISPEVVRFFKIVLSCEVFEVYGQSENGALFFTDPLDINLGHVGGVTPQAEFKLVDIPEMNYTSKDEVDGELMPRGEICVRGPS